VTVIMPAASSSFVLRSIVLIRGGPSTENGMPSRPKPAGPPAGRSYAGGKTLEGKSGGPVPRARCLAARSGKRMSHHTRHLHSRDATSARPPATVILGSPGALLSGPDRRTPSPRTLGRERRAGWGMPVAGWMLSRPA